MGFGFIESLARPLARFLLAVINFGMVNEDEQKLKAATVFNGVSVAAEKKRSAEKEN